MTLTKKQIKNFEKEEKQAEDLNDYRFLAKDVFEAGDREWALKLYKKAEELAKGTRDYQDLAEDVVDENLFGDTEWARKLFKKAEEKAEDIIKYRSLPESILNTLNDKEWVLKLYKKIEESTKDSWDYLSLAKDVLEVNDKEWAVKLFKKAEAVARDLHDYRNLAEFLCNKKNIGDSEMAVKLYKKAEKIAKNEDEYKALAESIGDEDYLGDKKWEKNLLRKIEKSQENSALTISNGEDSDQNKNSGLDVVQIIVRGSGGEVTVGELTPKQYDFWQNNTEFDIEEYCSEGDEFEDINEIPNEADFLDGCEWFDFDDILHYSFFRNDALIIINVNEGEVFSDSYENFCETFSPQITHEYEKDIADKPFQLDCTLSEKGDVFGCSFNVKKFDISKLQFEEFVFEDDDEKHITNIYYDGELLENLDPDTSGSLMVTLIKNSP